MTDIFFDESRWPEEAAALRAIEPPEGALVFGLDLAAPADGLAEMMAARRAGKAIALFPILRDPLEDLMAKVWVSIADTSEPEQRLTHIVALRTDQLAVQGGLKPSQAAVTPPQHTNAATLALRLADILLLGAPHERARWSKLLSREFRRTALLPVAPAMPSTSLDDVAITVFAPSTPRHLLRPIDLIVKERGLNAIFVTAENPSYPIRSRVVIAPEWWRSMRVRSLTARGHIVVAPDLAALHELDDRVYSYAPTDLHALNAAIDAARAASVVPTIPGTSAVVERITAQLPALQSGPLVSIIVRTYDRAHLLERSIASIVAQTYENVEIVVVNNGGPDVREIAERAAGKRLFQYHTMPDRLHIGAASNVGARAARGTYVGYLDDDDLLYADHCARTIEALERTGVDIAYTICAAEYAEIAGTEKRVFGFQIFLDRDFNRDALYVTNVTPIHSVVHRRDLFDRFGYFDETLPVTDDWELWLRTASRGGTFVHVDRVTCEYSWRHDPASGNMTMSHQQQFVEAYRVITARYAGDVAGRAGLHAAQQQTLRVQVERAAQIAANPSQAAAVLLSSMLVNAVPVSAVIEPQYSVTRVSELKS